MGTTTSLDEPGTGGVGHQDHEEPGMGTRAHDEQKTGGVGRHTRTKTTESGR